MSRRIFTLVHRRMLDKALECVREAFEQRPGSRVEVKGPKRTNDQNAVMWCMLGDIAEQVPWPRRDPATGETMPMLLDTEDWKLNFLDALRRHYDDERQLLDLVPNIDGTGFVNIGQTHSSDLSGEEMHDLLTIISAFGDQHGVEWSEPKDKGDQRPTPPVEAYVEERA